MNAAIGPRVGSLCTEGGLDDAVFRLLLADQDAHHLAA